MAGIQSLGSGSGILTSDLLDKLIAAERTPIDKRLTADKDLATARADAFGEIGNLLGSFQSAASALTLPSAFKTYTAASSNDAAMTGTASSVAVPGNYSVNVTKLAQAQTLASKVYTSMDSVVGEGTLQFTFGNVSYDSVAPSFGFAADATKAVGSVVISNSNHTLAGVRDAINNAGIGINASIVDTGSGYKLLMQSKDTGGSNGFKLVASNPSNGLDNLEFKNTSTLMSQTIAAQDAALTVNGLAITRASNTLAGAINGVTLNLKQITSTPVTLTVARNTEAITKKASDFVDAYNELKTKINEFTAFNTDTGKGSLLIGDTALRSISGQLRNALGSVVQGLVGTEFRTLSEVGIGSNAKTGLLEFNSSKFSEKLGNNAENLGGLFGTLLKSTDSQVKAFAIGSKTVAGSYAVNVTQLATRSVLTGAATAGEPFAIDATNDNLSVQIDGILSGSLSITQGNYTGAQLATEMQTRINGDSTIKTAGASVEVAYNSGDGSFSISSVKYGASSKVLVFAVDTTSTATLGISAVGAASGVDVAGTINGVAATASGQLLTGATGNNSEGFMVEVSGGATGSRGTVSYVRGVAESINDIIENLKATGGALTVKQKGLEDILTKIDADRAAMEQRLDVMRTRLSNQFSFNDNLISKLNSTGSYITQVFTALTNASKNK